jgi:hypothetical protein
LYYDGIRLEKGRERINLGMPTSIEPSVSVVVPTHNEEYVIAKRIENLLASKSSVGCRNSCCSRTKLQVLGKVVQTGEAQGGS